MSEVPPGLYAVVGILVVTNLSTVGALIVFIFKCGMFVAETKAGIEKSQSTANRAHNRLTEHERNEHGNPV